MNRETLLKLIKENKLDIKIPEKKPILNESFQKFMEENNRSSDEIVELQYEGGFTLLENFQLSEDMNERTLEKCKKIKEKYKDEEYVYISIMSKGNAVTQNRTLYPYSAIEEGLQDKTFKSRLKRKEVLMHGNHPSWWEGINESVFTECAVIKEFFWEEIDADPNICPEGCDPSQKKHKNPRKVESNGKPMIRLYAVFKLFGQHKEHLEDYIENARLGISSRGYGIGKEVLDKAEQFLYYELEAIQWETWDFVTRPSVEEASFTRDGELNENFETSSKVALNEGISSEVGNPKNETYNVAEQGSITEASSDTNPTEEKMNKEELLKFLKTAEGKAMFDEMVNAKISTLEESKQSESLKVEYEKLQETLENMEKELTSVKSTNEKIKVENSELQEKLADIEKVEFEAYKESVFAQYTEKYVEGLKKDTQDCENKESFEKIMGMVTKYFPESAKVDYKAPVEPVETNPQPEKVETVKPVETSEAKKPENQDKITNMIEKSKVIFS